MIKKLQFVPIIMLVMILLVVSCAPKPTVAPSADNAKEVVAPPAEAPTTGEKSVDEVATDISDASNIDEELDTSELDDLDSVLEDIENI